MKLIHEVRAVKKTTELANIIRAQKASEKVLAQVIGKLKPGVSEVQVVNWIKKEFRKLGLKILAFPPIVASWWLLDFAVSEWGLTDGGVKFVQ